MANDLTKTNGNTAPQPAKASADPAPKPLSNPNPIVVAGMKYSKEVILIVCIFLAFGIYALKEMDKNEFPSFTIREGWWPLSIPEHPWSRLSRKCLNRSKTMYSPTRR